MSEPKYIASIPFKKKNGTAELDWYFVSADDDESAITKTKTEIDNLKFIMKVPQDAEVALYRIEKLRKIIP